MIQRSIEVGYDTFEWPDVFVVDLLREHYNAANAAGDDLLLAKIHHHALHELYEGNFARSAAWRSALSVHVANVGLDPAHVVRADRLVFWELTNLVVSRFRMSARSRVAAAGRLQDALGVLVEQPAPKQRAVAPQRERARVGDLAFA